jgi:hypothetical protein
VSEHKQDVGWAVLIYDSIDDLAEVVGGFDIHGRRGASHETRAAPEPPFGSCPFTEDPKFRGARKMKA